MPSWQNGPDRLVPYSSRCDLIGFLPYLTAQSKYSKRYGLSTYGRAQAPVVRALVKSCSAASSRWRYVVLLTYDCVNPSQSGRIVIYFSYVTTFIKRRWNMELGVVYRYAAKHSRRRDANIRMRVTSIPANNGAEAETTEEELKAAYERKHQSADVPHLENKEQQGKIWSVVIPTYNRLPILTKALLALEDQNIDPDADISSYEVVVVDDGSSDGTIEFLKQNEEEFPHVRLIIQDVNGGAGKARNRGVLAAKGERLPLRVFTHAGGDDRVFTYGRVVNTDNFEDPTAEPFKLTDMSAAFFATGNVAISRQQLMAVGTAEGPFDTEFSEYGWEDLELGERLEIQGAGPPFVNRGPV
eukprot:1193729-Prorocentrum_minimum.AAC.3